MSKNTAGKKFGVAAIKSQIIKLERYLAICLNVLHSTELMVCQVFSLCIIDAHTQILIVLKESQ
jgi:hypothetical protein